MRPAQLGHTVLCAECSAMAEGGTVSLQAWLTAKIVKLLLVLAFTITIMKCFVMDVHVTQTALLMETVALIYSSQRTAMVGKPEIHLFVVVCPQFQRKNVNLVQFVLWVESQTRLGG